MSVEARTTVRGALRTRVRVGGSLAIVVALLLSLVVAPSHPTASAGADASQPGAPSAIVVCVGADGIMHAAGATGTCASGQTSMRLSPSTTEGDYGNPWNPQAEGDKASPASVDLLGRLEARATALENGPLFEVLDGSGRPILQVFTGKVLIRAADGETFVELRAAGSGGFVTARGQGSQEVSFGVAGDAGGLLLTQGGQRRADFGRQPAGNYSLRVLGPAGQAAAIGESQAGTGAMVIGDPVGRLRAMMSVVDGKGSVRVQNAAGEAVLALTEGATGGGLLAIGDATSEPMVKFGVAQNRYGVVLAGPVSGFPLVPGSGLPGSYFLGCAAAEQCSPSGGGGQR
ncbi:MAG TPA: hypothetical protein VGI12_18235 [Vicinamibacterales bacterium]|jgi:hypothetical protein